MSVRLDKDTITPSIRKMQAALAKLPRAAFVEWVKDTPIRSGRARRSTTLSQNTIQAKYPYAQRLDEGSSKQAPKGMTAPVKQFIEAEMRKIMRL